MAILFRAGGGIPFFTFLLCVTFRSHVRPLTPTPSIDHIPNIAQVHTTGVIADADVVGAGDGSDMHRMELGDTHSWELSQEQDTRYVEPGEGEGEGREMRVERGEREGPITGQREVYFEIEPSGSASNIDSDSSPSNLSDQKPPSEAEGQSGQSLSAYEYVAGMFYQRRPEKAVGDISDM